MTHTSLCCRHFDVTSKGPEESSKLFSVPDFVGDACKAIASRVRGAVAQVQFDDFHKVSAWLTLCSFLMYGIKDKYKG